MAKALGNRWETAREVLIQHGFDPDAMTIDDWEVLASWMHELPWAYTSVLRDRASRKEAEREMKERNDG